MPSGWYSCNSYAISKDNTPQGFVLFVKFVFSKIKRQILPDSNNLYPYIQEVLYYDNETHLLE